MFQKKSKTLHLIYILSILCKNTDIVQHIYKIIKNDHFYTLNYNRSFHICLSFHSNLLYSNFVKNVDNDYYYIPPFIQSSYHYWKPVKLFSLDDNYHFNFFSNIDYPINTNQFMATRTPSLNRCVRKLSLLSLKLKNFILIKDDDTYYEPPLSQKIKTINDIVNHKGINYFITIFGEFNNDDLYDCIILQKNNTIDTILGGKI
tara:strand:+ start:1438 stop:2046 length:609 start_codon:yes stop_codon:yes gene_type:complete